MPQPVSYNTGNPVSGSLQDSNIAYVVDGQERNYRGGFGGLSWMSEAKSNGNVVFIGNTTSVGRGPAGKPLFWVSPSPYEFDIINTVNRLPGSAGNYTDTGSAYSGAIQDGFFIVDGYFNKSNADGLVLYFDAGQPGSYPRTGTSWLDLSGETHDGTFTNGPTFDPTTNSVLFDGVDDSVPYNNVGISQNFSVSSWVNCTYVASSNNIVSKNGPYFMRIVSSKVRFNLYADGSWLFQNGTTILSNNRWYNLVMVRDGTSWNGYINGNLEFSVTKTGTVTSNASNYIGYTPAGGEQAGFNGNIKTVMIHHKALSQTEIKQNLFQSDIVQDGLIGFFDGANLVSYETGSTITYSLTGSYTGNSISGSVLNGVGWSNENGGSFVFDGVDDRIQVNQQGVFGKYADWSMDAWVKFSSEGYDGWMIVVDQTNYSKLYKNIMVWLDSSTGGNKRIAMYDGSWQYSNSYIHSDTWTHISCTTEGQVAKMYINGRLDATRTFTWNDTSDANNYLGIGGHASNSFYRFNGNIANVKIYNRTLTAEEVRQNYQNTKDRFQPTEDVILKNLTLYMDPANPESVDTNLAMSNLVNGNVITKGSNTTSSFDYGARSMISSAGPEGTGTLDTGFRTGSITIANNKWVDSADPWTVQTWICKHSSNQPNNWWHVITDGQSGDMFTVYNDAIGSMRTSMNNAGYGGVFDVGSDIIYGFNWRDNVNLGWNLITLRYDPVGQTVQLSINDQHDAAATGRVINPNYRLRNFHGWGSSNSSYHSDPAFSISLAYQDLLTDAEVEYNYNAMKGRFGIA